MGLFGALFAGVSGLDSQSNKIGIISNNIANVNTVGFKQGQAAFDTLVVPSAVTGAFSPGGVIGNTQQLVEQQGIVSATSSSTDIAISGGGLLFVSASATTAGETPDPLFTRSGSFTQDANGNFVNSNGYYLLGFPIDPKTGAPTSVNTNALATVNVSSSATGQAIPTSLITLGANLDADQTPLLGPGRTVALTGPNNGNASATQIIVGNDVPGQNSAIGGSGIVRGDTFSIVNNGDNTSADPFTYGGFAIGRNITSTSNDVANTNLGNGDYGSGVYGAVGNPLDTETGVTAGSITNVATTNTITVAVANVQDYSSTAGENTISISGASAINGIPASEINGQHVVTGTSGAGPGAGTVTFTVATTGSGASANTTAFDVSNRTYAAFAGNVLDAQAPTDDFLKTTTTVPFTGQALNFSINVNGVTTKLTYSSNADPSAGTFDSLDTLVTAINDATGSGVTAQVTNGRIYISATDPANTVIFENGDATGTPGSTPPLAGINWIQELGLPPTITGSANTFNSLSSLAAAINTADPANLTATVNNPTNSATLSINEANALQTIQFSDESTGHPTNTGSLLQEFGFADQGNDLSGTFPALTTGLIPQTYNPSSAATDMSSGAVKPQFTKDITIYDSLGKPHTIAINVVKLSTTTGTWAVELTSVPASDVVSATNDGQIAAGRVQFNGAGGDPIVSGPILSGITINWNNTGSAAVGANPSPLTLDLSGLTQAAGAFSVSTDNQNGTPTGQLTGVSINSEGFVIATFSNGQTENEFQVPLANFSNPDGLESVSGDAYQATLASGPINPELAGSSGVGTFTPSALEQSNVDLSTQLTDLIVAQQAYGANSKVLTVADTLLQELDQIIQ